MDCVIVTRPYEAPGDDAYIYSTWTKYAWYSCRDNLGPRGSLVIRPLDSNKREWFQEMVHHIHQCLSLGRVNVACFEETPSVIMGYIVVYQGKLEWLCVKKQFHHQGIDQLLKHSMKDYYEETGN